MISLNAIPSYVDIADATFAVDQPLKASTMTQLAHNAKFAMCRREVFQCTATNGQTIPAPVSPIDGYVYSYAEVRFWWTRQNSYSQATQKPSGGGCILSWADSVSAAGVVSVATNYFIDGGADTATNDGELCVFLFCQRNSALAFGAVPTWADVEDADFGGGQAVLASNLLQLNKNIRYACVRKEFFVQTLYNGQSIAPCVSPVDNYTYQLEFQAAIAAPAAPALSQVASEDGSTPAQTFFAKVTLVNPAGETTPSAESSLAVTAGDVLEVASPAAAGNASAYNVYVSLATGTETLQNSAPIPLGTAWPMPASGLVRSVVPPAANTTAMSEMHFLPSMISSLPASGHTSGSGTARQFGVVIGGMPGVSNPATFGQVSSFVNYYVNGGAYTPTGDGTILVLIVCTRQRGNPPIPPAVRAQTPAASMTSFGTFALPAGSATIGGFPIKGVGDAQLLDINGETKSLLNYPRHSPTVTGVINSSGQLVNATALDIAGSLQLGDWHNRVKSTIGGSGSTGLDNVIDGSTYLRMPGANMDANRRGLIDFGQGGHISRDQDHIPNGAAYQRTPFMTASHNMCANPGFEADSGAVPAGWQLAGNFIGSGATLSYDTATQYAGARSLSLTVPANPGVQGVSQPAFSVVPGQQYKISAALRSSVPNGIGAQIIFTDIALAHNYGGVSIAPIYDGNWHVVTAIGVVPANAVLGQIIVYAANPSNPATGSVDAVYCVRVADLDDEVFDGSTYLRMPGANMDANRRGLIDFTQGGHLFKHLGNIPDDSGSNRYAVLAIDGNRRPLIDGSSAHTNWTQDHLPDGATFRRLANVNSDNTLHVSTSVLKQGSIVPVAGTCVITFSATSSPAGVNVQVTAGTIYLPDGTTISVPAFNTTYTTWDSGFGIGYPIAPGSGSWSNIFQGNVVWNVNSGAVQVQQLKHYIDQVNPTPAPFTGANLAACAADGLIPLQIGGYAALTTAAGGGTSGGGGSGGGGDICPVADQPIETQERGLVPAGTLQVGEHLRGERDKWVAITARRDEEGDAVALILTGLRTGTETVRVSTGHRVMLHDGTWAAVSDIPLYAWLAGGAQLTDRASIGRQRLAKLSCEGHIYRLGSTLSHNTCLN